jgi:hypothetical protein
MAGPGMPVSEGRKSAYDSLGWRWPVRCLNDDTADHTLELSIEVDF